jgi:CubicO group peptidase (beta-lactamase class C family)
LRSASMQFCRNTGWWAGGIAIVHMHEPATVRFFGKARKDTQQPVDGETSYNWASITKTMIPSGMRMFFCT